MLRPLLAVGALSLASAAQPRQNVLFIVCDDLRTEMGSYGGDAITPNIDKLAASEGAVVFDRAYVQQAICCPTRSSFLTGRRPDTTLVWDLHTQFRDAPGGDNWKTLPQHFRDQGYTTAGGGKVFHPVNYKNKTDDVAGGSWSEPYFQPHGKPGKPLADQIKLTQLNCATPVAEADDEAYSDGLTAANAVQQLRNLSQPRLGEGSKPFFIAVGFHRPHLPWAVPQKYYDLYPPASITLAEHNKPPLDYNITGAQQWSWDPESGPRHCQPLYNMTFPVATLPQYSTVPDEFALTFRRGYFAAVSQTDRNTGVVLDELEALGLHKTTVVAFIGDHGWQLGDLGEFGKKTNFERATRTPFIIRDPSTKAKPATSSALIEFVDLMPTLIDLALGEKLSTCPQDSSGVALCTEGRSLKSVMQDPAGTADAYPAAFMQYASCMHDSAWHDGCNAADEPRVMGYAIRTRRWRYIEWVGFNRSSTPPKPFWDQVYGTELYDHTEEDSVENVAESRNVVVLHAGDVVKKLSKQLHAGWRAAL